MYYIYYINGSGKTETVRGWLIIIMRREEEKRRRRRVQKPWCARTMDTCVSVCKLCKNPHQGEHANLLL